MGKPSSVFPREGERSFWKQVLGFCFVPAVEAVGTVGNAPRVFQALWDRWENGPTVGGPASPVLFFHSFQQGGSFHGILPGAGGVMVFDSPVSASSVSSRAVAARKGGSSCPG